ncbi:MAG: 30S ribosomal protein S6 [Clostridia bacterium]
MNNYEVMYIINPTATEQKRDELIEKIKSMAVEKGGNVLNVEKMGLKRLAYPIQFKTEGYYVLMTFEAMPETIMPMEKLMLITENIFRVLFVKKKV